MSILVEISIWVAIPLVWAAGAAFIWGYSSPERRARIKSGDDDSFLPGFNTFCWPFAPAMLVGILVALAVRTVIIRPMVRLGERRHTPVEIAAELPKAKATVIKR